MRKFIMLAHIACIQYLLALVLMVIASTNAVAQNVTVSQTSGKLIAAKSYSTEVGFSDGYNAMWRHNQLPLTITVADEGSLTSNGQLAQHADNLKYYNGKLINMSTGNSYAVFALPKGYRFTGYKIVLSNNLTKAVTSNYQNQYGQDNEWLFYETDNSYNMSSPKRQVSLGTARNTNLYTIERTSHGPEDMGNLLYFVFKGNNGGAGHFGAIAYESIELTFAPDADFDVSLAPTSVSNTGASYVNVPFNTSKIDIGVVQSNTSNGSTYYGYVYSNVKDLYANNSLYEEDCVNPAVGTIGSATGQKSITSVKVGDEYYYGLGNHVYYAETPTSVEAQGNVTLPVHYRITGAKVNYARLQNSEEGYYEIACVYNSQTYYIGTDGQWSTNKTRWQKTDDNKWYSGENYLKVEQKGNYFNRYYNLTTTTNSNNATKLTVVNNNLQYQSNSSFKLQSKTGSSSAASLTTSSNYASVNYIKETTDPNSGDYKLTVYGADGSTIIETVDVTEGASGIIPLTDLNNDAVKFSITGLADGAVAPVTVDLTLQALNPYINNMDVVCNDVNKVKSLSQSFTSDDFSVGGDSFTFYVPADFSSAGCNFSFTNLHSKYADNTYYDGEINGKSRYSFVKSNYYNTIGENLYAHTAEVADHSYTDKITVDVAGRSAFTFNNAAELDNNNTSAADNYLKENVFSISAYNAQGGSFENINMNNGESKVYYLFTTDETRYNIAPTTATQHSYHAYYKMNIKLETKYYTPTLVSEDLYEKTLQLNKETNGYAFDSMKGVTLGTTETEDGQYGYLTVNQIITELGKLAYNKNQILYVDASNLYSVIYSADELAQLKAALAPNALVYLPRNATSNLDNFAYKTLSNSFRACRNIIIEDKQAFYAPHDISIDAANYAQYKRDRSSVNYGTQFLATMALPFQVTVDENGEHVNTDVSGKPLVGDQACRFTVNTYKDNELNITMTTPQSYYAEALFVPYTNEMTEANKPYMINEQEWSTDENLGRFTVVQYGSTISKTDSKDKEFGETSSAIINNDNYTLDSYGTYSGEVRKNTEKVFYFANNRFLSATNLRSGLDLYIYPFRGYFEYNTLSSTKSNLTAIYPVFEKDGGTTDIAQQTTAETSLTVSSGRGFVTIESSRDAVVIISSVSGVMVDRLSMKSGESQTITLPAGMYIINGMKTVIK